jgi:hypothetical protein
MRSKTKRLVAGLVAAIVVAVVAPAAQAATPAPGYEQFANCPSTAENPAVTVCLKATVKGGHFQMGSKDVPITNPMTLAGGVEASGNVVKGPTGPILTQAKQKVPGGVVGLTGLTWLLEILGSEALTLYAVTETAGTVNISETLNLPVKVHLVNSVLGNNCYVGSSSNPIKLALTTATTNPPPPNVPISGTAPEFSLTPLGVLVGKNGTLVDNSFSAPGASGCVLTLFGFIPISINGLVNTQSGLPAPAGTNETKQVTDQELTDVHLVYP